MNHKFSQHVSIFENALSPDWCDTVINWYDTQPKFERKDYWSSGSQATNRNNAKDLSTSLLEIPEGETKLPELNEQLANYFMEKVQECWAEYSDKCNIFGAPFRASGFKIQRTKPTEGYHIWHSELPQLIDPTKSPEEVFELISRYAVYTAYLNDDFKGGETEFLMQALRVPPKKGSICLFPASFTHLHRGNPPLTGEKYIITGWLHLISPEQPQQ